MSDLLPAHLHRLGLTRNPFPPTPDAACYFHTPLLEREQVEAVHCLLARKGFVLLTGEVGMGKSTFLRRMLDTLEREGVIAALVFNTFLQGNELLGAILQDFGLTPGASLGDNIHRLNAFLIAQWQGGMTCVLVIDDAQNLSLGSLELLRLLSNIETGQEKLLQIVLAGQPELIEHLAQRRIRQLTSRIVKHIRLAPLDRTQMARYVAFRLAGAGGGERIALTGIGQHLLHRRARGNPRRIHLIMDRCLYGVIGQRHGAIDARLVHTAAREGGAQATRARAPAWRWGVGLMLAIAAFAVFTAGSARRVGAISATPPAPSEIAARAIPDVAKPTATAQWQRCIDRAATPDMKLLLLPRAYLPLLQGAPALCLAENADLIAVAWHPQLRPEHFISGQFHDSVRVLQRALARQGLYRLPIDGIAGPDTGVALTAFQHNQQLAATGIPDDLTLLLIELAAASSRADVGRVEGSHVDH